MADDIVKPSVQAFLVCDYVICEVGTNKKTIVGTFTDIASSSFPCFMPQIGLYFCVTDAGGSYHFEVELMFLNTGAKIGGGKIPEVIEIKDRLAITDVGVTLKNLVFPGPGRYEFRLLANGQVIALKDFMVNIGQP
jgi:hypothetical protein